ncbi:MAG: hypothetical protein ACOYU0_04360 [Nitrospirota bacterium]
MPQRTWEEKEAAYKAKHDAYVKAWKEKDAAYKAKHDAYVKAWKEKDAAFKKKEKEELAAHHKAFARCDIIRG